MFASMLSYFIINTTRTDKIMNFYRAQSNRIHIKRSSNNNFDSFGKKLPGNIANTDVTIKKEFCKVVNNFPKCISQNTKLPSGSRISNSNMIIYKNAKLKISSECAYIIILKHLNNNLNRNF